MALVFNASSSHQQVKVFGNYFELKPGQIKNFEDKIAHFMVTDRKDRGFVSLPEEFMEPSFKDTEEGKAILEEKRKQGIEERIRYLRMLVHNEEVSLQRDHDKQNDKTNVKLLMSDGMIKHYEELASYQTKKDDEALKKAAKIEELQKKLKQG